MKTCTKCKEEKSIEQFPPNKKTLDKRGSWCKGCVAPLGKEDYKKNKVDRDLKTKKWQKENRHKLKGYRLKKQFNMSNSDFDTLLKAQDHKCLICNAHESQIDTVMCIDHCHSTGKIRGLLCRSCNLAIGLLKDNIPALKRAIDYLDKNK